MPNMLKIFYLVDIVFLAREQKTLTSQRFPLLSSYYFIYR